MHGCVTLANVTQEAAPFTVVCEPRMKEILLRLGKSAKSMVGFLVGPQTLILVRIGKVHRTH